LQKFLLASCLIIAINSGNSHAQIPGDFNCDGRVNGVDVTRYFTVVSTEILTPIDTSTCFWHNGDTNGDSLYANQADALQIVLYLKGLLVYNEPLPAQLDSMIIGNVSGLPGDTVSMPINLVNADDMVSFELGIHYDNRYLLTPSFALNPAYAQHVASYFGDTISYLFENSTDTLYSGNHYIGDISFSISENTPIDTILNITLEGGWYFPSGFIDFSYPTNFINPILGGGFIYIRENSIDELHPPCNFNLFCFPNPFNSQAQISFELEKGKNVTLAIYNILGQLIEMPINSYLSSGRHEIVWDASRFSSGIYFCRLIADNRSDVKRITLMK
jgi:hypothetical protein